MRHLIVTSQTINDGKPGYDVTFNFYVVVNYFCS